MCLDHKNRRTKSHSFCDVRLHTGNDDFCFGYFGELFFDERRRKVSKEQSKKNWLPIEESALPRDRFAALVNCPSDYGHFVLVRLK